MGALGLAVNVLVLWNTLYMDAALAHLRRTGAEVKPEDVARLSPLGREHINVLRRYIRSHWPTALLRVNCGRCVTPRTVTT